MPHLRFTVLGSARQPSAAPRWGPRMAAGAAVLDEINPEDVAVRRALVFLPAGMDARVTAVERAVVPCEPVRIGIGRRELRRFEELSGLRVVLVQPGALLAAGNQPDRAVVKGGGMRARHAVGDQKLRLPCLGIDAENPAQPQRRDVEFPIHVLDAVAAAAAERNLAMADRL